MNNSTPNPGTGLDRRYALGVPSSLHCSIASVNPDGTPHVTPIGSLLLAPEPGRGIYFDMFNARLSRNVNANPDVCVLAVDSRKPTWLRALVTGRFNSAPGVQLLGTVGRRRIATSQEIQRLERALRPFLNIKGGRILWHHDPAYVRDIEIHAIRPLRLGALTGPSRNG